MDDELRNLLSSQIEDELRPHHPRGLRQVVERGRRRRLVARLAAAAAVVGLLAVAAVVAPRLSQHTSDRQQPAGGPKRPEAGTMPNGCPASPGTPENTRWTSPTARVASGTVRGEDWVFCARTAERIDTSEESLCTNWRLGESRPSGMDCVFSYDGDELVALDEDFFEVQMAPTEGYTIGAAPGAASSVELEKTDGTRVPGEVHPAPERLGVPFSFFTLFHEPLAEGVLLVRDPSGEVLVRRKMEHGLSQLFVAVSGEGSVQGYRTDLVRIYEECRGDGGQDCREPRPAWIDCPEECRAALADGRITLVARPAEGATFRGWSGACSGTEPCELVVDRDTTVEAEFSRPP